MGDRHAGCIGAAVARSIHGKRSPAASDIEQTLPRLQLELVADQSDLLVLRRLQILIQIREEGAGIDHPRSEKPVEEIVASIVVVLHDPLILLLRVDRHFGNEPGEEEFEVIADELVGRVISALPDEIPEVAFDFDASVDIVFDHVRDRRLRSGRIPGSSFRPWNDRCLVCSFVQRESPGAIPVCQGARVSSK